MTRLDAEIAGLRGQRQALPAPLLTLDGLDESSSTESGASEPGSTWGTSKAYYHHQGDQPFQGGRHTIRKAPSSMGIFSRTRDIIAANFNDLLEKAEDPAKMIRLIILEMEETLVEVRTSSARTIADQKEMRRHVAKLDKLQADWSDKAQLALSKDREDLARAALLERKKAADMGDQLKAEIEVLDDALRAYEQDIEKLQNRLREARTRQSSIAARLQSAENRVKLRTLLSSERVDEAMVRFDQLERRVDYAEGRAESMSLGDNRQPSLADEIAALESGDSIEAELAEMKRQMGDKPAATSN
ncbi:phage shock protein PspA [Novosphingobium sp. 9U]|uniref:phage shock protein PspA n=1 Tax=Novosphingobium sp. 9U TaxID=2653158 RepID=UPI0012F05561|nr:phage shock protein PspA [Novosphingobium sp. 9U]VWX46833.1 Phage shock protein A [Novosphingobium sp. 9U]